MLLTDFYRQEVTPQAMRLRAYDAIILNAQKSAPTEAPTIPPPTVAPTEAPTTLGSCNLMRKFSITKK